jgi:hypothetical protein
MTPEDSIIHLCQVITHWVTKRGQAMSWQEKGVYKKCDQEVKKWVKELKEIINGLPR